MSSCIPATSFCLLDYLNLISRTKKSRRYFWYRIFCKNMKFTQNSCTRRKYFFYHINFRLKINHWNWYKNAKCIIHISSIKNVQAYKNNLMLNNWIFIELKQPNTNILYKVNNYIKKNTDKSGLIGTIFISCTVCNGNKYSSPVL